MFSGALNVSRTINFRADHEQEKVVKRLKRAVIRKYGKLHRVWAEEIVEAIERYLPTLEASAHTQNPGKIGTFHRKMVLIYSQLPNGKSFHRNILEMAVERHAGADDRTKRKYLRGMEAWELVVPDPNMMRHYMRGPEREWVKNVLKEAS